jgi:hypothetical protein
MQRSISTVISPAQVTLEAFDGHRGHVAPYLQNMTFLPRNTTLTVTPKAQLLSHNIPPSYLGIMLVSVEHDHGIRLYSVLSV